MISMSCVIEVLSAKSFHKSLFSKWLLLFYFLHGPLNAKQVETFYGSPGKANEQQQREWLAEYEKLKQSLPVDETICFMDGVHPTQRTASLWLDPKRREKRDPR